MKINSSFKNIFIYLVVLSFLYSIVTFVFDTFSLINIEELKTRHVVLFPLIVVFVCALIIKVMWMIAWFLYAKDKNKSSGELIKDTIHDWLNPFYLPPVKLSLKWEILFFWLCFVVLLIVAVLSFVGTYFL